MYWRNIKIHTAVISNFEMKGKCRYTKGNLLVLFFTKFTIYYDYYIFIFFSFYVVEFLRSNFMHPCVHLLKFCANILSVIFRYKKIIITLNFPEFFSRKKQYNSKKIFFFSYILFIPCTQRFKYIFLYAQCFLRSNLLRKKKSKLFF